MILVHGQAKVHQLSASTWQPGCHLPPDLCLPCLGWMDLRQKHLQRQFWQKAGLPQPNLLPDSKMSRRNYTNGVLHIVWAAWIKCLFCHFWVQMTVSLDLIFIIDNKLILYIMCLYIYGESRIGSVTIDSYWHQHYHFHWQGWVNDWIYKSGTVLPMWTPLTGRWCWGNCGQRSLNDGAARECNHGAFWRQSPPCCQHAPPMPHTDSRPPVKLGQGYSGKIGSGQRRQCSMCSISKQRQKSTWFNGWE